MKMIYVLAVLFAAGCASGVQVEKDQSVSTRRYQTYRWITPADERYLRLESPPLQYLTGQTRMNRNPVAEAKLHEWIDAELRKNGYAPTSVERPDFFVTYYFKDNGNHWQSTWEGLTPALHDVPVVMFPDYPDYQAVKGYRGGSLLLVVYDATTRRPSWQGRIPGAFDASGEIRATELIGSIQKAVNEFKGA